MVFTSLREGIPFCILPLSVVQQPRDTMKDSALKKSFRQGLDQPPTNCIT